MVCQQACGQAKNLMNEALKTKMIRLAKSLKKLFRPLAVIIFGPRGTWGADVLAPVVFALMGPPDRGSHIYVMYIMKAESDRSAYCMKTSEEVAVF